MNKEISVVIPNYNGKSLLEVNLPSVMKALALIPGNHEVIIPDDASKDDSLIFLNNNYPEIIIVENKTNKGFSPNINSGIFRATKDLVFALNSDVLLTENYFEPLMKYFDDENVFGVMGRIVDMDGDKIQDGAKYPDKKGFKIKSTLNFLPVNANGNCKIPTFFMSGANSLMDRKKLFQIGGYNELFAPFYVEDVDLSLRAWRMGWKCYYENSSICKHPNSVTIGKHSRKDFVKIISIRNQIILQEFHLEGLALMGWRVQLMMEFLTKWLTFNFNFYKAFFRFLQMRNGVYQAKNKFINLSGNPLSISSLISKMKSDINQFEIEKF